MLVFKEYDTYIEYLSDNVIGQDSVSLVLSEETLNDVLATLSDYVEEDIDTYITVSNNESEEYMLSKTEYKDGEISIVVEPLYRQGKDIPKQIEDELVIIEDKTIDEDDIEEYVISKTIKIVGLEYNQKEEKCECYQCENCADRECSQQLGSYIKDNTHIDTCEEYDEVDELIDSFVGRILETQGCPGCIREIVEELYFKGYDDGGRDEALALHDALNERLFGDE